MTGSVAMLERSVYNWLFGVRFTLDGLQIKPCLPKEYANSQIVLPYLGNTLTIQFNGYGNKVLSASVNGKIAEVEKGALKLGKNAMQGNTSVSLDLTF